MTTPTPAPAPQAVEDSDPTQPGNRVLRVAVISDLHASAADVHKAETYAKSRTRDDPRLNPLAAIQQLVESDDSIQADLLLCPGDLTHKADTPGLIYAWETLGDLGQALGTDRLVATTGNHDVVCGEDLPDDADADTWVQALRDLEDPGFPGGEADEIEMYFSEDFVVVSGPSVRVVALNSCARHGEANEFAHGTVSEKTRNDIDAWLTGPAPPVNILLCHHHPEEWRHMPPLDTGQMAGGEALLAMLEERSDASEWIVVHGHRHIPALGYSGASTSGPTRFSAGSAAVNLQAEGRGHARNQFYLLEFDLDELATLGLSGGGRFRAWDFSYSAGMVPASNESDLPSKGGFGFRRRRDELADMARSALALGRRSVTRAELEDHDGRWRYVAPEDIRQLRRFLRQQGHLMEPRDERAPSIERISFAPPDGS